MKRFASFVAVLAFVLTLAACVRQSHEIAVTPELMKRVGLPVYPRAAPFGLAHETTVASGFGTTSSLILTFQTRDDTARVKQFYEERVPKNHREIKIPIGGITATSLTFYDKTGQKQVMIVNYKDTTVIELQSTTLNFAASPSPGATPAAPR